MKTGAPLDPLPAAAPLDPVSPQNPLSGAPTAEPPLIKFRRFDDIDAQREAVYESAVDALRSFKPLENATHRLELADIDYDKPFTPTKSDEKRMLLEGASLHRPLRGTVRLIDKTTETPVDEQRITLARIPHVNSRGLFIRNGVVWTIRNQARLRPGVYARKKADGGTEAQFNVKPGTGRGFRVFLEPETGLMKMQIGQSTTRLYPVLRQLGIDDEQIKEMWGDKLFDMNYRPPSGKDIGEMRKVVSKLGPSSLQVDDKELPEVMKDILNRAELDPETTEITLGEKVERLSPDVLLGVTRKVLAVARGEDRGDNRDSQAFQSIHGAEDFVKERLSRDQVGALRKLLWKASREGKLGNVATGLLDKNIASLFEGSGLAMSVEDINPLETFDIRQAITRLGQGGISSEQAVSRDARGVQASYLGVIDSNRGPESSKLGLDLRVTDAALKGSDNQLYTTAVNVRTGKPEIVSARTLSQKVVAFPGELDREGKRVAAVKDDDIKYVGRDEVDYVIRSPRDLMSRSSSMVPFPQSVKGQRLLMGARMLSQAMPLREPEAPLVQTGDEKGDSLHKEMGRYAGAAAAPVSGTVIGISDDEIKIRTADGEVKSVDLYNNYPTARKTLVHNTPLVTRGQQVKEGDILAKSNFTDDSGTIAIGRNLRVAYMAAEGSTIEDAFKISESAAKKLTSEALYKSSIDLSDVKTTSKSDYMAIYADKYTPEQYQKLDDDGVVRIGAEVHPGDPLIIGFGEREKKRVGTLMDTPRSQHKDMSEKWEHNAPGVVTDVTKTRKGIKVTVKSYDTMRVADKLCYSPDHEVLTSVGWVPVGALTCEHEVASLEPVSGEIEYLQPEQVNSFDYQGPMYVVESTQVSMCVTPNHKLFASRGGRLSRPHELIPAEDLAGKTYRLKLNGTWRGESPGTVVIPGVTVKAGQGGVVERRLPDLEMPVKPYLALLGLFLSEGSTFRHPKSGSYGIDIAQTKSHNLDSIGRALSDAGLRYTYAKHGVFRVYSKILEAHFSSFGKCYTKSIPDWVFSCTQGELKCLYDALMLGDGHTGATCARYTTTSPQLADDVQRLCLHVGLAARVGLTSEAGVRHVFGRDTNCVAVYDVHVYRKKFHPTINHGHIADQSGQAEYWIDYKGKVYCPTLPRNHVLYVRRCGRAHWSGNSNLYGGKGVISCYDDRTWVFTEGGWKLWADVTKVDRFACLIDGVLEFHRASALIREHYTGELLHHESNSRLDYAVTPNHRMWCRIEHYRGREAQYSIREAKDVYGKCVVHKCRHEAVAVPTPETFTVPLCHEPVRGKKAKREFNTILFAELLGYWLAEGSLAFYHGDSIGADSSSVTSYKVQIAKCSVHKPAQYARICSLLTDMGLGIVRRPKQITFSNKSIHAWLSQFKGCDNKRVPEECWRWGTAAWRKMFDAMVSCDGKTVKNKDGTTHRTYYTTSVQLAEDVDRLACLLGYTSRIALHREKGDRNRRCYEVVIRERGEVMSTKYSASRRPYDGEVYCAEVPGGLLLVRRSGCSFWCGNSIVPDEQMPMTEDGKPIEVIQNALGIVSRTNPGALAEALLGKVARVRGEPYVIKGFDHEDVADFALKEALKYGVITQDPVTGKIKDTETLIDPRDGSKIPGVFTGESYFLKLQHMAEGKLGSRDVGAYTNEGIPAKGGEGGSSKRIGMLDVHALLSAGATNFLKEAKLIRGQRNDDYWRAVKTGEEPLAPTETFANQHFKDLLKAAGVNIREKGSKSQLSPMLDEDVDKLAQHEIDNPGTFDFETMRPVKGGLFDMKATGGAGGGRFAKITLPKPVPHPLFIDPIQKLLDVTGPKLASILSGKEKLGEETGPEAVIQALSRIDIDREMGLAVQAIKSGRKTARDKAVKRLNYLAGLKNMGIKPEQLMITKLPVIPPKYRPITTARGMDMIHDLNYLYHDLLQARENYTKAEETFGDAGEEYGTMANAVQAVVGSRAPVNPKSVEQDVKGVLRYAIGVGSTPKAAKFQRQVIGSAVDTVGRGVITADKDLDIDEVGVPETMAYDIFRPYIIRRLHRQGMPAQEAVKAVRDRLPVARKALEEEMDERPVVYNRAPSLHRYSYVGAWGKLRDDDAIGMPYHTLKGIGGDFDGDTINIHVPASEEAIRDTKEKLMPSKNLFSAGDFETHLEPMQDYLAGLYLASKPDTSEPVRVFANEEEARRAFARGQINARTPIRILES